MAAPPERAGFPAGGCLSAGMQGNPINLSIKKTKAHQATKLGTPLSSSIGKSIPGLHGKVKGFFADLQFSIFQNAKHPSPCKLCSFPGVGLPVGRLLWAGAAGTAGGRRSAVSCRGGSGGHIPAAAPLPALSKRPKKVEKLRGIIERVGERMDFPQKEGEFPCQLTELVVEY